jgi:hypothetical protein
MADNWAAEINGDEDDEEALRIAIAMSLGQDPGEREEGLRAGGGVIDLTKDDDDGSTTDSGDGGNGEVEMVDSRDVGRGSSHANRPNSATPQPAPASNLSAFGLDRKRMEEERLARLGKRKAAQLEDVPPPSRPAQRPRIEEVSMKKEKAVAARPEPSTLAASAPVSTSPQLPFPQGVIKKTWAYGQPRQGDDIKIEEVLQKQQLELAVLSSFQWDEEWMLRKIDLARTKLILIAFATDEAQVRELPFLFLMWEEKHANTLF